MADWLNVLIASPSEPEQVAPVASAMPELASGSHARPCPPNTVATESECTVDVFLDNLRRFVDRRGPQDLFSTEHGS